MAETVHFFARSNVDFDLTWHKCKNTKCSTYCILRKKVAFLKNAKCLKDTSKKVLRHIMNKNGHFCHFLHFYKCKNQATARSHNDSAANLKSHVHLVCKFCSHFVCQKVAHFFDAKVALKDTANRPRFG